MELRKLKPEEIRPRVVANNGGVKIMLWKDPMANLAVIDDSVGITNRSVSYSDDGKRCTLSIRIDGEWISNDGCAFEGSPDNPPNDALNHAGFAWGIGNELYHAPEMFIYKDKLKKYHMDDDGNVSCYDDFKVTDISYDGDKITSITIAMCEYGKPYGYKVFTSQAEDQKTNNAQKEKVSSQTASDGPKADAPAENESNQTGTGAEGEKAGAELFPDDEVILIGNCKGKTYGEVKGTELFGSFLNWTKKSKRSYTDPRQADQFERFKKLAS